MPFQAQNVDELKDFILTKELEFDNDKLNSQGWDILKKMLEKDPKKRISIEKVLDHPFIKSEYDIYLQK